MPRYKILIEYDGTDFYGWQRQPEGRTVERTIEEALSQILQQPIDIIGQGRTDSGVHAEGQVAHFDYPEELDGDQLTYALLGVLPRDVSVYEMEAVSDDFHARFHARSRRYRYQIARRPSPLTQRYAELILDDLDVEAMQACAKLILGVHDFESFTKSGPDQERTECEVMHSEFERHAHLLIYHIEANRFLRHLVRRLVGTMILVGKGRETVEGFKDLLNQPNTETGGHGAPPQGLILENVKY